MSNVIDRSIKKAYEERGTLFSVSVNLTDNLFQECNKVVAKGWFATRQEFIRHCIVNGLLELNGTRG